MATKCIDTHVHLWDLNEFDYSAWPESASLIRKNYSLADYLDYTERLKATNNVDVVGFVFVQVLNDERETEKIIQLSQQPDSLIRGIVGWTNLQDLNIDENIKRFKRESNGKLVAIRHLIQSESTDDWILQSDVLNGLRVLQENNIAYDLQLRPRHLKHIPDLLAQLPQMKFIIDHIAKPRMDEEIVDTEWFEGIEAVAKFQNVHCKLSGLINEVTSAIELTIAKRYETIEQYLRHILKCFGLNRCIYGTDWPVFEEVGATFSDTFGLVDKIVLQYAKEIYQTEVEVQNAWNSVFYQNGVDFYGL